MLSMVEELKARSAEPTSSVSFLIVSGYEYYNPRGPAIFWAIGIFSSVIFAAYNKYGTDA